MTGKQERFDLGGVMPFDVTQDEIASLLGMFNADGWKVFMRKVKAEAEVSVQEGMSLSATDDRRASARGLYHGQVETITFEQRFRDEVVERGL